VLTHYLRVADLTPSDLRWLLNLAAELKREPDAFDDLLDGAVVALHFAEPSTRARVSFTAAVRHLGGVAVSLGPSELQLGRGETIEDTARVLSAYVRAFVVHAPSQAALDHFAAATSVPVVNAGTDGHHPCQALADLLTIQEHFGDPRGVRLAYIGDGGNVAHSLLEAGAIAGMEVVVASPPALAPDPAVVRSATDLARLTGATIHLTDDPAAAVRAADVVYTHGWRSTGGPEAVRAQRFGLLADYRVDHALMGLAAPGAVFMHCLPARRGEEVAASVIDGPRSVVLQQAANRLATQQALLATLVEALLVGRTVARCEVAA